MVKKKKEKSKLERPKGSLEVEVVKVALKEEKKEKKKLHKEF